MGPSVNKRNRGANLPPLWSTPATGACNIANTATALSKLLKDVSPNGEVVSYCYEAGPCGYGIYRQISDSMHDCSVVAPSLIPTKPGDRVKTDRRDSENLARLHRAGRNNSGLGTRSGAGSDAGSDPRPGRYEAP